MTVQATSLTSILWQGLNLLSHLRRHPRMIRSHGLLHPMQTTRMLLVCQTTGVKILITSSGTVRPGTAGIPGMLMPTCPVAISILIRTTILDTHLIQYGLYTRLIMNCIYRSTRGYETSGWRQPHNPLDLFLPSMRTNQLRFLFCISRSSQAFSPSHPALQNSTDRVA